MKRLNVGFLIGKRTNTILIGNCHSAIIIGYDHHTNEFNQRRTFSSSFRNSSTKKTTVVLCHGCFGFASQFFFIEKKLIESGKFRVLNYWYPSYRQSIERSSEGLYNFLNEHRNDDEHVLSRSGSVWYSNVREELKPSPSSIYVEKIDNEEEYHFVTHSMGSMIVRNFLVNKVQNNKSVENISNDLLKQSSIKLIQVSPLLSGRVKLARDLKFLYPVAKFLRSYPDEPTIVEQFMNHVESEGWEGVFTNSFWWTQDSILSEKVRMTNIVTSMREFEQHEPSLFSDLVLTVDEQTATLPLHLDSHTELVYMKGDHASILNREVCIDKIIQVL